MICKLLPTSVLFWFMSKDLIEFYHALDAVPMEKIHYYDPFSLYFNSSRDYEYDYMYEFDPNVISMWVVNGSFAIRVSKNGKIFFGGVTMASSINISPVHELFWRLAKRKIDAINSSKMKEALPSKPRLVVSNDK